MPLERRLPPLVWTRYWLSSMWWYSLERVQRGRRDGDDAGTAVLGLLAAWPSRAKRMVTSASWTSRSLPPFGVVSGRFVNGFDGIKPSRCASPNIVRATRVVLFGHSAAVPPSGPLSFECLREPGHLALQACHAHLHRLHVLFGALLDHLSTAVSSRGACSPGSRRGITGMPSAMRNSTHESTGPARQRVASSSAAGAASAGTARRPRVLDRCRSHLSSPPNRRGAQRDS